MPHLLEQVIHARMARQLAIDFTRVSSHHGGRTAHMMGIYTSAKPKACWLIINQSGFKSLPCMYMSFIDSR